MTMLRRSPRFTILQTSQQKLISTRTAVEATFAGKVRELTIQTPVYDRHERKVDAISRGGLDTSVGIVERNGQLDSSLVSSIVALPLVTVQGIEFQVTGRNWEPVRVYPDRSYRVQRCVDGREYTIGCAWYWETRYEPRYEYQWVTRTYPFSYVPVQDGPSSESVQVGINPFEFGSRIRFGFGTGYHVGSEVLSVSVKLRIRNAFRGMLGGVEVYLIVNGVRRVTVGVVDAVRPHIVETSDHPHELMAALTPDEVTSRSTNTYELEFVRT